ncbi:D-galactarate dehydratase [Rhodobacteraceae bacterium ASV31]|nr:D-galactarate dehydratase [Anianabacter salinae]
MFDRDDPAPAPVAAPVPAPVDPVAEPGTAETAEGADAVAAAPAPAANGLLGTTVASLGNPADSGLWMSTPLVAQVQPGRITYPASGVTVAVELRPSGGAAGSGSQVSLQALQALKAPITGLPQLEVYAP